MTRKITPKGKYLVTSDNWFLAPDGQEYRSAWGEVFILEDGYVLGIKTNAKSTNWYVQVGIGDKHVLMAGCQIHFAVKSNERPSRDGCVSERVTSSGTVSGTLGSRIYFAE